MRGTTENDELSEAQAGLAEAACYLEKAADEIMAQDPRLAATLLLARDRARGLAGEDAVISTRISVKSTRELNAEQAQRDRIATARRAQGKD